jgi:hypothetical protein
MAKAAPSFSSTARLVAGLTIAGLACAGVALAGCARSAPDLPPDYGSVKPAEPLSADRFDAKDLALSCRDIAAEQQALVDEAEGLTGIIRANRQHNQAAGYFGGLFLFPLVATRHNQDEKNRLDAMQARWDTLEMLDRFRSCPGTAGPDAGH